ncbi:hypothetical protein CLOM_g12967 [Closterium sp. NIES-68]|nr:hypothetical protein CLOM_g12967 [Closterium sp. NIES-68]GJP61165.1 hypothetical protein CLOP_g18358 [Closterium sp. NIES-67]
MATTGIVEFLDGTSEKHGGSHGGKGKKRQRKQLSSSSSFLDRFDSGSEDEKEGGKTRKRGTPEASNGDAPIGAENKLVVDAKRKISAEPAAAGLIGDGGDTNEGRDFDRREAQERVLKGGAAVAQIKGDRGKEDSAARKGGVKRKGLSGSPVKGLGGEGGGFRDEGLGEEAEEAEFVEDEEEGDGEEGSVGESEGEEESEEEGMSEGESGDDRGDEEEEEEDEEEEEEEEESDEGDSVEDGEEGEEGREGEEDDGEGEGGRGGAAGSAAPSPSFAKAFASIMTKNVAVTGSGKAPILAARKKLLEEGREAEGKETSKAKVVSAAERKQAKLMAREMAHVLPEPYLGPKEKALVKIATKGVVRLFNAVSKAQKVQKQASSKDAEKKTKAAFLTELRGSTAPGAGVGGVGGAAGKQGGKANPETATSAAAPAEQPTWSLLADSFQLGQSKLKGWDKGDEEPMAFDPEGIAIGELDDDDEGGGEEEDGDDDDMDEEEEEGSDEDE